MTWLLLAALVALTWANRRNQCDDCGSQLLWCDPESDAPLTRCFTCDGPHRAYIREEFWHQYDFVRPTGESEP